ALQTLTAQIHWVIADFDKTVPIHLANNDLGVVEFGADAEVQVNVGATLHIGFGVQLDTSPSTPTIKPFLLGSTDIAAHASLVIPDLTLTAKVLGVEGGIGANPTTNA